MKAIRIHDYGGADVLRYEDAPTPAPGPDEVLIKIHGAVPLRIFQSTGDRVEDQIHVPHRG